MSKKPFLLGGLLLASTLTLSACGEGFVTEDYYGVPYGEERTAHHGVAYVRAKMAPPAGPVVEQKADIMPEQKEVVPALAGTQVPEEEPEVMDADPLFIQESKK